VFAASGRRPRRRRREPQRPDTGLHDPDERVRATALQYVARLAGAKDHDANHLLADVLARGAPLLKLGCIAGCAPTHRPRCGTRRRPA
jgi:hypothetical protein